MKLVNLDKVKNNVTILYEEKEKFATIFTSKCSLLIIIMTKIIPITTHGVDTKNANGYNLPN